ncbi:hypothetical protein ACFSE1_06040 [Rhizobium helianthi]|uniref:Uncharacterized protein n=1 Tax=Rhizobium helianthi TaxID=1132695 RepID=A0ABW4M373_9HYPH
MKDELGQYPTALLAFDETYAPLLQPLAEAHFWASVYYLTDAGTLLLNMAAFLHPPLVDDPIFCWIAAEVDCADYTR